MNKVFITLIILFVGFASILIIQATQSATATVLTPSELSSFPNNTIIPRARVAGMVSAEKLEYSLEPSIQLKFRVQDPETENDSTPLSIDDSSPNPQSSVATIPVVYKKLMPDMFAPGRAVIIDGEFRDGTLHARELMTQCPSKYKPPTPTDNVQHPSSIPLSNQEKNLNSPSNGSTTSQ